MDLFLFHDHGQAVLLAGFHGDLGELLRQRLAAHGYFHNGLDGLGRNDEIVLVVLEERLDRLPFRAVRRLRRQVGADGGDRDELLEHDAFDIGAGQVLHGSDHAAQLVLERHRNGVGARKDILLDGRNEVGRGRSLGLVLLDGEHGRKPFAFLVRIISQEGAGFFAVVIPVEVAGESGPVIGHLHVGGIGAARADDGQADDIAILEIRFGHAGDHRFHLQFILGEIHRLGFGVRGLVAGDQGQEGRTCENHHSFHDSFVFCIYSNQKS